MFEKMKRCWSSCEPCHEQGAEVVAEPHECTAESVVARVLGRDVAYFDYNALPVGERKKYVADAQRIVRSPVFQNELSHFLADLVNAVAKQTKSWEEVQFLRATINGLETLRERLEAIEEIEKRAPTDDEPFGAV